MSTRSSLVHYCLCKANIARAGTLFSRLRRMSKAWVAQDVRKTSAAFLLSHLTLRQEHQDAKHGLDQVGVLQEREVGAVSQRR
eukprot:767714-Hanusia_phi.AAC.5